MIDLKSVASEIRELISERQKSLGLVFEEDKHIYTMNGKKDYPSVSKVLKSFYREFPLEEAALKKAGGNPQEAERLKEEWAAAPREPVGQRRRLSPAIRAGNPGTHRPTSVPGARPRRGCSAAARLARRQARPAEPGAAAPAPPADRAR